MTLSVLLGAVCFTALQPGTTSGSQRRDAADENLCGAHCLYVALRANGVELSFERLIDLLGPPSSAGYSMQQLRVQAEKHGLKAITVETSLSTLEARKEKFCCITLINESHYVILADRNARVVCLVDYPKSYSLPDRSFQAIWSRRTLLIGQSPFESEERINQRQNRWRLAAYMLVSLTIVVILGIIARTVSRGRRQTQGAEKR